MHGGAVMEKRDEVVFVRLTKTEKQRIQDRMAVMGIKNMSAFARKMILDGYCVKLDLSDVKELVRLMGYAGNNLNLSGNPVIEEQLDELREALPDCEIIYP